MNVVDKKKEIEKIRKEVVNLKQSSLYEYRTAHNYVPVIGEGSYDASIVFVGEAPGENEAKTGKPFCGRSGKLLDELLASIRLDRQNVYITNVVNDRPQDNRDPTQEEINLYSTYLYKQFAVIQPKVIVMLGRISMKAVFTHAGIENKLLPIGDIHGKSIKATFPWGEAMVMPLYHPAYALYNGSKKQILFDDFKKLKKFI